jgi:hypothetical protein
MKRHSALTALSRDHQHALAVAQRLRRATPDNADEAAAGFRAFWEAEGRALRSTTLRRGGTRAWKLAPALAGGNCSVLKPASPTPWSILKFAELAGGEIRVEMVDGVAHRADPGFPLRSQSAS